MNTNTDTTPKDSADSNEVKGRMKRLVGQVFDYLKPSRICNREGHRLIHHHIEVVCKPSLVGLGGIGAGAIATAHYTKCDRCGLRNKPHKFKYKATLHRVSVVDHRIEQWKERGWFENSGDVIHAVL